MLTYECGFRIGKPGHYLTHCVCEEEQPCIIPVVLHLLFSDEGSNLLVASLPLRTLYLLCIMFLFIVTLSSSLLTNIWSFSVVNNLYIGYSVYRACSLSLLLSSFFFLIHFMCSINIVVITNKTFGLRKLACCTLEHLQESFIFHL